MSTQSSPFVVAATVAARKKAESIEKMKADLILPARAVRRLRPYDPVSSLDKIVHNGEGPEPLKLDWNESTMPPAPGVREALTKFLSATPRLNWYPPLAAGPLLQRLGDYTGLTSSSILVTNGSDDCLNLVCTTYLDEGDRVLVPYPTYTHLLVFAGARGAHIDPVAYDDPFKGELKAIMGAMTPATRLLYLVNPNNPTGVLYTPAEVRKILNAYPGTVVVVDEAYHEFGSQTCAPLVDEYPNLVVIRTFSKSFGLAGMRVGYLLAQPSRIQDMRRVHNPKSVNVMGLVAAAAALDDIPHMQRYVAQVTQSKELACKELSLSGLEVVNTPANWVLLRVPCPSVAIEALEKERVFVRDRSVFPQLYGFIRITLGTIEQTNELLVRLKRAFSELGWLQEG